MTSSRDWNRYYDMVNRVNRGQANSQISSTGGGATLFTKKPSPFQITGPGSVYDNLFEDSKKSPAPKKPTSKKTPTAKKPAPKKAPVAKKPAPKKPTGKKK